MALSAIPEALPGLAAERRLDPPHRVEVPVAGAVVHAAAGQVEAVVEERLELHARREVAVVAHVGLDRAEGRPRLDVAAPRAAVGASYHGQTPFRTGQPPERLVDRLHVGDEWLALVEDRRGNAPRVHTERERALARHRGGGARGDEGAGDRV